MEILNYEVLDKQYTLIEAIEHVEIEGKNGHLKVEEFKEICKLYNQNDKTLDSLLQLKLDGMKETKKRFKSIDQWNKSKAKDKIITKKGKYTNLLYYYSMVLCRRLSLDLDILNGHYKLPRLLTNDEKTLISSTLAKIGYKSEADITINAFNKLRFYFNKDLRLITEENFYEFRQNVNNIKATKVFNVLKYWGNIPESSVFKNKKKSRKMNILDSINTIHKNIEELYYKFKEYTYNTEHENTALRKISIGKKFIEWLNLRYQYIDNLSDLEYKQVYEFFFYIKNKEYSIETVNSEISRFKTGLLRYLLINKILNEKLQVDVFSNDAKYNELYFDKIKSLPVPVSLKDRKLIEKAIFKEYSDIDKQLIDIIRLCYFLGARPSEVLSLKINCIKGVYEAASLYIHRAKGFKERYIPLIDEAYEIVDYWAKINKNSLPVYLSYDKETSKRLFQRLGRVYELATIESIFSELMRRNDIVNNDNKARYSLYILRKIRITTWLENDLSEEEVAYLAGHDSIDSHNSYIINKELKKENASKVYNELYKDVFEKNSVKEQINEENNSEEEFINLLQEIEQKSLNIVMKEQIIKEFNELILPMPCGSCTAKVYDESFECEVMELPCLECKNLIAEDISIELCNEFVKRIFISRSKKKKKGLDGLVMKAEFQIERLKQFYINKLHVENVEHLFKNIEKDIEIKRGRPRGGNKK